MTKLLLDQGLPRSSLAYLISEGIDAIHVGDIGGSSWADASIVEFARAQGRAIVTLDADFHALLAASQDRSPSVIRIRIEGLRGKELAEMLLVVLSRCEHELAEGAVVTVQPRRIRLRHLPLVS